MGIVILIIGVVVIVAAIRDTHEKLFGALAEDLPAFMVWAAAVFALGAIGWIPGMNPVSRGLLALVIVVIVLTNYKAIIGGLSQPLGSASEPTSSGHDGGALGGSLGNLGGSLGGSFGGSGGLDLGDFAGRIGVGLPPSIVLN